MRKLLSHFTDGLFGYRLRYKRWRRWPLLVVLALVWAPLAGILLVAGYELAAGWAWPSMLSDFYARYFAVAGAIGQGIVGAVIVVFLPLVASRAFTREKAAGNMLDLVLLPVKRRRLLMGRLGRVFLPFALLVLWSSPAYVATPLKAQYRVKRWEMEDLPLVRMTLATPAALTWANAVRPGWRYNWSDGRSVPIMGFVVWGDGRGAGGGMRAFNYAAAAVPFATILSFVFLVAVCGVCFSLRSRTWLGAALKTYLVTLFVLAAEMIPFVAARGRFTAPLFAFSVLALALMLRGALPLLLLRDATRNFDRYALGER